MKNSSFPIKDRIYFLKNDRNTIYDEYRYKEHGTVASLKKMGTNISFEKAKVYLSDKKLIQRFLNHLTLPYEEDVWNHAPPDIKQAIIISYAYHEHEKNNKVANVETINWIEIPFFQELLTLGKQQASLFRILPHFRTWFNATTMTNGNHKKNLRLGHIHLTQDFLDGKTYSCVHWDIGASRFSYSLFVHWLFDDMSS